MVRSEIAVLRFGLGARPGELTSAAGDPKGWLRAQIRGGVKREFGINENLAREILELHTLGVDGAYTQQDVATFAQIITGWSIGGGIEVGRGPAAGVFQIARVAGGLGCRAGEVQNPGGPRLLDAARLRYRAC
jgi:uncharacterized protein (DUF1800 family)